MNEKYYIYDRIAEMYWTSENKEFADKRKNASVYDMETVKKVIKTSYFECVFEPVKILEIKGDKR